MARVLKMKLETILDSPIPYSLPYLVPLLLVIGYNRTNPWMTFLPTFFVFLVVPIADLLSGLYINQYGNNKTLTRQQVQEMESRYSFRIALYLWVPLQQYFLFWTASRMNYEQSWTRICGLVFCMGIISAGGINCAHELLHKACKVEQVFGKLLLCSAFYGHFYVEHTRGHHKKVATWDDPATARLGESVYHFLPRTLCGSFKSAWELERARLKSRGHRIWGMHNELLWFHLVSFGYACLIATFHGRFGLACFVAQAAVAILLLEEINAIEHYGLERKLLSNGSYEPVGPQHSWDAPQAISGYLLFKLQRHADHHLNSRRRYQALQLSPESPRLPAGYTALIPLLLIPTLWRAVMDFRVLQHRRRYLRPGD